jgi:hypothetical protein
MIFPPNKIYRGCFLLVSQRSAFELGIDDQTGIGSLDIELRASYAILALGTTNSRVNSQLQSKLIPFYSLLVTAMIARNPGSWVAAGFFNIDWHSLRELPAGYFYLRFLLL